MVRSLPTWLYLLVVFGMTLLPASADENKPPEEKKAEPAPATVAHIRLGGSLDEAPLPSDPLFGTSMENFKSKIDRIKKAKDDKNVYALYLHIDPLGIGWAKVQELRGVIADFRKSGKKAYAFVEGGETKDYLVACECDVVCLPEPGWLMVTGLRAEVTFFQKLLEKLGIRADFLQMGVYKFAAEPYTRSQMSPEAKANLKSVLDDFFDHSLVGLISQSRSRNGRKLSPGDLEKLIDEGPFTARRAAAAGLIDKVAYADDFEKHIKELGKDRKITIARDYGKAKVQDLDLTNPFNILKLLSPPKTATGSKQDRIALIYAVGVIVTGKGGSSLLGGDVVGSTTMIEAIRKAEEDPKVRAIVLRVDSPGGSALASDLIWNELKRCKKPVIASMSDVAASGGYYISMAAKKIYAQPGTLTGSIGVVGGKMALKGLYDKVGITTEVISRGANAGILSTTEVFSKTERKAMEALMADVYDQFLTKAIAGRSHAGKKFSRDQLVNLAEGRIWTGRQACANGLVDAVGSLEDAIAEAKVMGGLRRDADVDYLILPKARSVLDTLLEGPGSPLGSVGQLTGMTRLPEVSRHLRLIDGMLQLRAEPVWLMLPHGLEIK
jgi:protease-4